MNCLYLDFRDTQYGPIEFKWNVDQALLGIGSSSGFVQHLISKHHNVTAVSIECNPLAPIFQPTMVPRYVNSRLILPVPDAPRPPHFGLQPLGNDPWHSPVPVANFDKVYLRGHTRNGGYRISHYTIPRVLECVHRCGRLATAPSFTLLGCKGALPLPEEDSNELYPSGNPSVAVRLLNGLRPDHPQAVVSAYATNVLMPSLAFFTNGSGRASVNAIANFKVGQRLLGVGMDIPVLRGTPRLNVLIQRFGLTNSTNDYIRPAYLSDVKYKFSYDAAGRLQYEALPSRLSRALMGSQ